LGTIVSVDNYHISKKALKGIINGKIWIWFNKWRCWKKNT
jgi:hypothetical protein